MIDTRTNTGKAAFTGALAAVVVGVCVLAGWLFDLEFLKRIVPGFVAMNPATAVAFILAGASLALFLQSPHGKDQKSRALILTARLCALVVTLIGLAKLAGILGGWDLGVDRWLFASKLPDGLRFPNRMAPYTAFNFLLLGGALLFVDVKNRSVRFCVEFSVVIVGFGSLLAVMAYAYDIQSFYGLGAFIPMALHTAITFSVLIVAFLLSHTDSGLLAVFAGESAGGKMARRLLPAAVLVPAVLGWLTLQGEEAGIYHGGLGEAAFAVESILVFTFLVCWSAKGLFSLELERKQAEAALRESEARTGLLVKSSNIGLWDWNLVTNEVFFSAEWKRQLGYTDAELPSRFEEWESRLHPEDREPTLAAVKDYCEGRRANYEVEFRLRHKDGSWRWILTRASLTRNAIGQPVRIMGGHIDITERKQAEEALQESERRYQSLAETSPAGVFRTDENGQTTYVNVRWCELTGLSVKDALGEGWMSAVHPEDREAMVRGWIEASTAQRISEADYRLLRRDGSVTWVMGRSMPDRNAAGRLVGYVGTITDITERKRGEEQIEWLSRFPSENPNPVLRVSAQGVLQYANAASGTLLPTLGAEVGGAVNAEWRARIGETLANAHPLNVEMQAGDRMFSATLSPVVSHGYVNLYARDTTERKQAEEAFRASEAEFRTLAEAMPQIVWITRPDGRTTYISQQWVEYTGLTLEESLGYGWTKPFHPEDQPRAWDAWQHAAAANVTYSLECRLRRADGEYRWWLIRGVPQRDATGNLLKWFGTSTDIHDLKLAGLEISRTNQSLQRQQTELRVLFDLMPALIWFKDTENRILRVNQRVAETVGKTVAEIEGKLSSEIYPPEAARYYADDVEVIRSGEPKLGYVETVPGPEGQTLWVQTDRVPVRDKDGKVIGLVVMAQDITTRKRAEAELEQSHRQLVAASRQAGMAEFATGVLHNIGNVLNSVNVAATCMADSLKKSKSANLAKVVALMREHETALGDFFTVDPKGKQVPGYLAQLADHLAGEQATALKELGELHKNLEHIKHLITVQQDSAKRSRSPESVQLTELIEDTLKMNANGLHRGGIQVIKEFQEIPPVLVEKHKVLQILVNLVRNAMEACEASGSHLKRLTIRMSQEPGRVRIEVADNGGGIASENLARIFAHGFTTKKDGHGFGLHSSALAATEMGGALTVQSDGPGCGATFTLELPAIPQEAKPSASSPRTAS